VFVLFVAAASPFLGPLSENFHLVIPGRVYRSGQLSAASLGEHAAREGIRTVINLRGANPGQAWYDRECAAAHLQDLNYYDLPVDSQCPTASELRELLNVLESCPKPALIHCQSGIDRSGIVAAICVLLLDESGTVEQARTHLGWRYGHMPWRDNMSVQVRFLQDYENWLRIHGRTHDRSQFRAWLWLVSEHADGGCTANH
jgi:undecaprenyl-diphosphatase